MSTPKLQRNTKDSNPKGKGAGKVIGVRFDDTTRSMLDALCEAYHTDHSNMIRMSVKALFDRTLPPAAAKKKE